MNLYAFFQRIFFTGGSFWWWRDPLEILFFITIFYFFSLWLKKDRQKNLLFYFYCYCCVIIIAFYAQLPTLSTMLFLSAPVALMLFILVHQETLQKNFISLKNASAPKILPTDWLEELLRTCLVAINNNKEVLCVIEHRNNLETFLEIFADTESDDTDQQDQGSHDNKQAQLEGKFITEFHKD